MCKQRRLWEGLTVLAMAVASGGRLGAEPPSASAGADVAALLAALNSEQYEIRQQAGARLAQLATRPDVQQELARQVRRALTQAETSYEVRAALAPLAARLPPAAEDEAPPASSGELDDLLAAFEADSFARRAAAELRLAHLSVEPRYGAPILVRLKARLADPALERDVRGRALELYERARGAWLLGDAGQWPMPPVAKEQIDRWITDLAGALADGVSLADSPAHATAQRELLDLLARDDYVERVKPRLAERLAETGLDEAAEARLRAVFDWTLPAMVAECWNAGRHTGIQHLVLGVPNQPAGALRPSLFDRCDEQTAHCVSGNSLSPGDHPVGVLFPHPKTEMATAQFLLVNLPTPRRRMAYEYYVQRPERLRLAEISQRTLDAILRQQRPLSTREVLMLEHLDAVAVSRFVGPYLRQSKSDPPANPAELGDWTEGTSLHTLLCSVVARIGTHEAVEGLTQAIEAGRFQPGGPPPRNRLPWLAALSIAARDPWPEVDAWLARLIPSREQLSADDSPTDVGASAAALLVSRHGAMPAAFGLSHNPANPLEYRFAEPRQRQEVLDWWARQAAPRGAR